jgi:YfiH family protein
VTPPFIASATLETVGVRHGFFGRNGGVSSGAFLSLNASLTGGDDPDQVRENRARIATALGYAPHELITVRQVHSADVVTVAGPLTDPLPEADALVSATPGVLLGILTADCSPILLADPQARIIGAAHAGWKGALSGIVGATVTAMEQLGADRGRIIAAIGPTISVAHYEVGPDFMADALALAPGARPFFSMSPGQRPHFDLPGFVAADLATAGVRTIDALGLCTYADPERFFSHRFATHQRTGAGRQLSVIGLI